MMKNTGGRAGKRDIFPRIMGVSSKFLVPFYTQIAIMIIKSQVIHGLYDPVRHFFSSGNTHLHSPDCRCRLCSPDLAITYTIVIQEDGTAIRHVEYRTLLASEDDVKMFNDYAGNMSSTYLPQFEDLMQRSAA